MEPEDDYFEHYDPDMAMSESCEKCGGSYDHIGFDFQYCRSCGWDASAQKWDKPIEPTTSDFMNGEADILTGRWY